MTELGSRDWQRKHRPDQRTTHIRFRRQKSTPTMRCLQHLVALRHVQLLPGLQMKKMSSCTMSEKNFLHRSVDYKSDIVLAFVKNDKSGPYIPRGRTRLRLVRPLGMYGPDKSLITQAADDIYNLSLRQRTISITKRKRIRF